MSGSGAAKRIRVAELFAGVGGFRIGLERASTDFETIFSSQWEPPGTPAKQFASRCYVEHFGPEGHSNEDIAVVLDRVEARKWPLPPIDMVVGGFPCQDYSVAKPLNQAAGLVGKKGVLWWQIHRLLRMLKRRRRPARWVVLENVDRLLRSPANQRGRDFAIMLASLVDLGYEVEWRVINASDYGLPQRRRRVFIVGRLADDVRADGNDVVFRDGLLANAFRVAPPDGLGLHLRPFEMAGGLDLLTRDFGRDADSRRFGTAGFARREKRGSRWTRLVWTTDARPTHTGPRTTLGDIVVRDDQVPPEFIIDDGALGRWRYVKGAKAEQRVHKGSGFVYHYTEGALPFPDPLDRASRTVLTSEGGASPSRSKHIVQMRSGRYRRLTPVELERLNGFEDDWTATGMTDTQRAFCMGNALVIGIVERIAREIAVHEDLSISDRAERTASAG